MVKEIQGSNIGHVDMENIPDNGVDDMHDMSNIVNNPLSNDELQTVSNLFNQYELPMNISELQKVQRLEQLASGESVGKIKRAT